jgi:hypothetical protein
MKRVFLLDGYLTGAAIKVSQCYKNHRVSLYFLLHWCWTHALFGGHFVIYP